MEVKHSKKREKFFMNISGTKCSLEYEKLNEKLWDFKATKVPEHLKEQDIAGKIIEYAIHFVKENGIKIFATCSCVQDYLVNHRESSDVLYHPY